jgi:hypothetical protein
MIAVRALLVWTILTVSSVGLSAASYYVTQSGAGGKNGSSLANAWSVATYNASSAPTGGDTVYFSGTITSMITPSSGGVNTSSVLTLDTSGATLASPAFTINEPYITLNGGAIATDAFNTYNTIIQCNTNAFTANLIVQNFTYAGASNGTDAFVDGGQCSNVTVQNNHATGLGHFYNSWRGVVHNIMIENNYAQVGADVTQDDDVIQISDSDHVTIQGNYLENDAPGAQSCGCHNDVIQTYQGGGSSNQAPSGWIIRYNRLISNPATIRDGSNSWTMIEEIGDGSSGFGIEIYSNVFVGGPNAGGNGLGYNANGNSPSHGYIYNNTVISPGGPTNAFGCLGNSVLYFSNNAAEASPADSGQDFAFAAGGTCSAGATWDHNWAYQEGGCTSTVSGPHGSCSTNLGLANFSADTFSLASTSPLLNAGDSTIGAQFNQGIAPGATWPNPALVTRSAGDWDVGAYQSGVSVTTGSMPNPPTALSASAQ